MTEGTLGRRVPTDWKHVEKYPIRRLMKESVQTTERTLALPKQYIPYYDQGSEGACVGFGSSWMMSILNRHRYDARRLYLEAQKMDEWSDTPPEEGTSVRAGLDVLRKVGHWRYVQGFVHRPGYFNNDPELTEGIEENRWATTVDEIRTAISSGVPVVIGVNWYRNFDRPMKYKGEWWIGRDSDLGTLRGGHCTCLFKTSDRRGAFGMVNNWGQDYPRVWISYEVIERLIREDGEVGLVVDRLDPRHFTITGTVTPPAA